MDNKHEAFDYPDNNILMYLVTWEEDLLKKNYEISKDEDIFFPSTTNRVRLDKFKTDVLLWGGMNPWISSANNKYPLILSGAAIQKIILAFITFWYFV